MTPATTAEMAEMLDGAGIAGNRLNVPTTLPKSPVTKPGNPDLFELAQDGVERDGSRGE